MSEIPVVNSPVVEMVTLIQISLSYFNLLSKNYQTDGLLCEDTKRARDEWWETYGKLYLGTEKPRNECTLGPTTVAGLISLILCCYFQVDDRKIAFPLRIPLMKLVSS
ncbi:AKR_collapsed_G0005710.mRNA.1.CDS.1 [Saccharomyces cerevisiae]|nr:AKR_collapsed_G0005710.mRNA.1.CDS.1 [Saccharomyces cerevisiae]